MALSEQLPGQLIEIRQNLRDDLLVLTIATLRNIHLLHCFEVHRRFFGLGAHEMLLNQNMTLNKRDATVAKSIAGRMKYSRRVRWYT